MCSPCTPYNVPRTMNAVQNRRKYTPYKVRRKIRRTMHAVQYTPYNVRETRCIVCIVFFFAYLFPAVT